MQKGCGFCTLMAAAVLICGCAGNAEFVTVPAEEAPAAVCDAAALGNVLGQALSAAAEHISAALPARDAPLLASMLPDLLAAADPCDAAFLREAAWSLAEEADGLCTLEVRLSYLDAPDAVREHREALRESVTAWGISAAQFSPEIRVLLAHEALLRRCRYAPTGKAPHSAYGAWICGEAVCDGYAAAFSLLMREADIPCIVVTGTAVRDGQTVPHAWNLVQLGGRWYHIDCAWDDTDSSAHRFFLLGDAAVCATHTWDREQYPSACGGTLSYASIIAAM